eukprot:scaffold267010_cov46-Prasinocladus_malaysianus.AAC.1
MLVSLSQPFSMGRNLLCVHSKKHIMDDPATRSQKMKENVRTLKVSKHFVSHDFMFSKAEAHGTYITSSAIHIRAPASLAGYIGGLMDRMHPRKFGDRSPAKSHLTSPTRAFVPSICRTPGLSNTYSTPMSSV